jgi:ATP-dependent Clp protease ATP-binding subunit ClpA
MWYKGNDMDLRTPYWRASQDRMRGEVVSPGARPFTDAGRGAPIAVDASVLACCNGAYDAAVFHGAREVRPEHLLYALTRVEPARDVLEQHGVRTQVLKREAAALLNSEPTAGWDSRGSPTASAEFEDLLRRAAQRAGQDGVPASVHDVLRAAVTSAREGGVASVLLHAASDPQALERWASEPAMPLGMGAPPSLQLASLQPDSTDRVGARLDQLETSMRALAAEVAADRKAIVDILAELRQDIRSSRSDPPAALGEIQTALDEKVADLDRSISALSQRFETVRGFTEGAPDVESRLAALETRIGAQPPAIAEAVSFMLSQRRDERDAEVAQRLTGFEGTLRAQAERMEEASKAHEHDLSEVYEALVKIGTNQQTLGSNLEAWRQENAGDLGIVSNRVQSMEQALRAVLPRPRPEPAAAATAPASDQPELYEYDPPTGSFKRWLFGTTRVLPSSWREDMTALRNSVRRRNGGE